MGLQPFKQEHFPDSTLRRLVSQLATWAGQFTNMPILQGRLIEDIAVTTATVTIDHKLGRTPRGWIICKKNADARVWETASTSRTITLDSSATVTVSIWIF